MPNRAHPMLASLVALTALSAATYSVGQAPAAPAPSVTIPYETYKLPNGLNVILSRDTSVPVVAVNLWYHVGSANEDPGRTGFAHLFEHMMFQGSEHVGDDQHFKIVQEAGGDLNGTTSNDRTNYFETVPSNYLETALWLESDRMGFLLPAMTQEKLDNQRSVVQNERRQRIDNQPYGRAWERVKELLYPEGHPYHHPVIGSMEDLNAASMDDVMSFFRRYYAPNNASLAIVGDFDPDEAKRLVRKYFGDIPPGPPIQRPSPGQVRLTEPVYDTMEDQVQLPRLYLTWATPAFFQPGDAELDVLSNILTGGKNSRLHRRLVYDEQIAQFVSAFQASTMLGSEYMIVVQANPGVDLDRIQAVIDEELDRLRREPPTQREVQRAINNYEAGYVRRLQSVDGKADQLNMYQTYTGTPGYIEEDMGRYRLITPQAVQEAVRRHLGEGRVVLSVVPQGKLELQAEP